MSLGKYTKCDLSAGKAKLDIDKVAAQIEIHCFSLIRQMQNKMSDILNNSLQPIDRQKEIASMVAYGADDVVKMAEQIAVTTELLNTLNGRTDRIIEIV